MCGLTVILRLVGLGQFDRNRVLLMIKAVVCGEAELQTSQCRAYLAADDFEVVIIWSCYHSIDLIGILFG